MDTHAAYNKSLCVERQYLSKRAARVSVLSMKAPFDFSPASKDINIIACPDLKALMFMVTASLHSCVVK